MTTNILLVTVDSLRYDSRHFLANVLDRVFDPDDIVDFDRAFATGPGTTPSFPALLTGTHPLSFGGLGPLSAERPRLSALLGEKGYTAGGFHCNPFLSSNFNYEVGFDEFEDYQNPLMGMATRLFPRGIEVSDSPLGRLDEYIGIMDKIKKLYTIIQGKPRPYVRANVIVDDSLEWISHQDGPYFCWSHFMDVHHPCYPPKEYRREEGVDDVEIEQISDLYSKFLTDSETLSKKELTVLQRTYDAAIKYTADEIQRLFRELQKMGEIENTLIVVTSDHGELFGEHDQYGKPERMYDELLHVPLYIINGPDHLRDARTDLVSLVDIPPLILDAVGINVPDAFEGRIPGQSQERSYVVAEHEVHDDIIVGARSDEWLYELDEIRNETRLFDLTDGFERADSEVAGRSEVRAAVDERMAELDIEGYSLQNEVDGEIEDRLEDLGYL